LQSVETIARNARESIAVAAIADIEKTGQFQRLPATRARVSRDRPGAVPRVPKRFEGGASSERCLRCLSDSKGGPSPRSHPQARCSVGDCGNP
jgi:hypothetical protein